MKSTLAPLILLFWNLVWFNIMTLWRLPALTFDDILTLFSPGRAAAEEGGENSRSAQQSSQGILRFYTDDAPGFQM